MKKLIFLAGVVLTLASHAAYERFAFVRMPDVASVTNAAAKLGNQVGVTGLNEGVAVSCLQNLPARLLGAQRVGAPSGNVMYIPADGSVNMTNLADKIEMVVLYPATRSRADFLTQHKDEVTETNGVIRLVSVNEFDCLTTNYVAFTQDGLWATLASSAELASAALQEAANFQKEPFEGAFCDFIATDMNWAPLFAGMSAEDREAIKSITALKVGLCADDKGLDVRCWVQMKKDSALAREFSAKLTGAALAFADKNALFASECAAGGEKVSYFSLFKNLQKILAESGLKTGALVLQETNNTTLVTLDVPRLIAENKGVTNNVALAQLPQLLFDNRDSLTNNCAVKATTNTAPLRIAFALKDAKGMYSPAERFAAVLPEAKEKPLFSAFAGSFYGLAKVLVAQCVASKKDDDESAKMISFMLAALPPAELGGTAGAYWCEGDILRTQYRLSAGELKGLSTLIQLSAGLFLDAGEEEADDEESEEEANEN